MPDGDLTALCDRLQDQNRLLSKVITREAPAPVVNVAAPQVRVEAPHVTTPVHIEKVIPQRWEHTVSRDGNGFIKLVVSTPVF